MATPTQALNRLIYDKHRLPERLDPFNVALTFADSPLSVLISGGAGSGKKCLAIYLHMSSGRKGPFLTANLQGLGPAEQGTMLFGDGKTQGLVEKAANGTLYLDEITAISPAIQQRLAAMLSHGSYEPWPTGPAIGHSVRIVASTRAPVSEFLSGTGIYSSFLFNLARVHIKMPPTHFLGRTTLELLAKHWLEGIAPKKAAFDDKFWDRLDLVRTEGNLHELKALVQRAYLVARLRAAGASFKVGEADLNEALVTGIGASDEYRILSTFEDLLRENPDISQTKLAMHHPDGMGGTDVVRLFVERTGAGKGKASLTKLGTFLDLWKAEFPSLHRWLQAQKKPKKD